MAVEAMAPLAKLGPQVELIADDGEPMESGWHVFCMFLLIESIYEHFRGRDDFFAAGNQFIYFNEQQAPNRDIRGPDFYLVLGVPREPLRPYWCVWEEQGRYPNVIIELLSPTTAPVDLGIKKDIYEQTFRTPNYYCYDPNADRLEGWQLKDNHYESLTPNEGGWLWCSQANLWLGTWQGQYRSHDQRWLRFYRPDGELVLTADEVERQRAEAALAELAQLKERLARQEAGKKNGATGQS